ncbi:hypothetical protein JQ607_22165 [Bradyrhizobium liaoningense]|uniref:hypothetical protein n=1 Tax=Bradyrhizobium liaoningense TaxID=43992 RepID=UPI001BA9C9C5|nr:hypothetical protein [Bradyrhizobium liaoningense]MBR0842916.1 hypothetical protein [Bradyrhizobium liaoningense]
MKAIMFALALALIGSTPSDCADRAAITNAIRGGIRTFERELYKKETLGRTEINYAKIEFDADVALAKGYYASPKSDWDSGWGVLLQGIIYDRNDDKSYLGPVQIVGGGKSAAEAMSSYLGTNHEALLSELGGHSVTPRIILVWISNKPERIADEKATRREAEKLRENALAQVPLPQKLYFVARAFIPKEHPTKVGYIFEAPFAKGKYIFEGPRAPSDLFRKRCYNSDNRLFSDEWDDSGKQVSSKIAILAIFSYVDGKLTLQAIKYPKAHSIAYDCETGIVACEKESDTIETKVYPPQRADDGRDIVEFLGVSSNRCVPESSVAGSIDVTGTLIIDKRLRTAEIWGAVDDFPAFEFYIGTAESNLQKAFTIGPAQGATVMDLISPRPLRNFKSTVIAF